jgi:hypothetical protein
VSRKAFVIALVAAFLAGCAGGVVSGVVLVRFGPHGMFGDRGRPSGGQHGQFLPRLTEALSLTPAQHDRLDTLFVRARRSQMATRESLRVAIEAELTPQQLEKWHRIEAKFPRSSRRGGAPPPEHLRAVSHRGHHETESPAVCRSASPCSRPTAAQDGHPWAAVPATAVPAAGWSATSRAAPTS